MRKQSSRRTLRRRKIQPTQLHLDNVRLGGHRPGAGRPKEKGSGVSHDTRPTLSRHHPVHITLRVQRDVPHLRTKRSYRAIAKAMQAGKQRFGFRLVHHAVQSNHIHLIVEAKDRRALSRGMQGLSIRIARALNRACDRQGKVFSARYHAHALRSPSETKRAIHYVLNNWRKHGRQGGRFYPSRSLDWFSSALQFDGWRGNPDRSSPQWIVPDTTTSPHGWLLKVGWRRSGLLESGGVPSFAALPE